MAKLTVTSGETAQKDYALRGDARVLFGRDATCDIVLAVDTKVSRRHAVIKPDGEGGWILADLDSRNGTHVNRQPVTLRRLADGDMIRIGRTTFDFHT